ncbi:MAG: UbiA family prenyltransferase [Acidovorax sp.]|uniref:UbiA family prenyltransferase n=1 Tax=Acidovorax sp. TaxID=1872122 RepID=UPI0022C840EF|nr:UbiA family prenyltransferase [Acidovorax sp.]MCZ8221280.1 UbiA family prenyltransferase [Acidovorax sp.]
MEVVLHPPAFAPPPVSEDSPPPLVVDLDGTLVFTDMLHETAVQLFCTAPLLALRIPAWLLSGKAALKKKLAENAPIDAHFLPYNLPLIDWLREQGMNGRSVILCTASDELVAHSIAAHCGFFDDVMASKGTINLTGDRKAQALVERFGCSGFDYVGNSLADIPVWSVAREGIVVNASPKTSELARQVCDVTRVFSRGGQGIGTCFRALRIHHWTKNVLLFVALIAAHQIDDGSAWMRLMTAFVAFSLCASSIYITNDLLDLAHDRRHSQKRARPFAAGDISLLTGVWLILLLTLCGFTVAMAVGTPFVKWLSVYFVLTWMYMCALKRVALIDCMTLAALYVLRIVSGAAAVAVALSFWLLAFSGFLFLSLAFVKRYAELHRQRSSGEMEIHGRGYVVADAWLVQLLGVVSGYSAVLVLALYLNSDAIAVMYKTPELVWGVVPVTLFWISWMWMRASRGQMHDDPLVFAFRERVSLLSAVLFGAMLVLGSWDVTW